MSHRPASRSAAGRAAAPRRVVLAAAVVVALLFTGVSVRVGSVASSAETIGSGNCPPSVSDGLTTATAYAPLSNENPTTKYCKVGFVDGTGTWTVPAGVTELTVLVVAGGGGGGNLGGGGGGGLIQERLTVTPGAQLSVTVGVGGVGGTDLAPPTNGADTVFGSLVTKGGGAGGSINAAGVGSPGSDGGNGGGGAPNTVGSPATGGTGAAGGAANPTTGGHTGGAGKGATTVVATTVAGGGGGGPIRSGNDAMIMPKGDNPTYVGDITSGGGGVGVDPSLADGLKWNCGRDACGPASGGFAEGGGGGVWIYGTLYGISSSLGGRLFTACYDQFGDRPNRPQPGQVNTGQGGGGGCGLTVSGGSGGSGIVVIAYTPSGGAAAVPGAPSGVSGTPGTGSADVTWTPAATDGGSAITGYSVEHSTDGGATWTPDAMCTGATTACIVSGLANGTDYVFHVSATNANGPGPWSDPSSTVTPGMVPQFTG